MSVSPRVMRRRRTVRFLAPALVVVLGITGLAGASSAVAVSDSGETIAVGNTPQSVVFSPDGARAYVTNKADDTVSVIDTATASAVGTITVGDEPHGLAISPNGALIYVPNIQDGTVSVIDTSSNTVVDTITVGAYAYTAAFTSDGTKALVANYTAGTVSIINVASGLVTATLSTPGGPEGIAVSPDDTFAYVSLAGAGIYIIDLTNDTVSGSVTGVDQDPVTTLYPFLTDIIFSPDGAFAYTTDNNNAHVLVVDVATNAVVKILTVDGAFPAHLAITPDGSTIWVAFGQGPAGTEGIQPIDLATKTIGARVTIGDEHTGVDGIAVSPSGNVIYVVNKYNGTVSIVGDPVLRVSGANRYETAIKVSQQAFPAGADTVLIATGVNYPDALAAGPAAAKLDGPLLLTNPTALPAAVKDEIVRLNPSNIIIVGGIGAVSASVEASLNLLGATVIRKSGADRYATARAITSYAFGSNGGLLVYLATGRNFPDALSAGAAAAAIGVPVILVNGAASSIDQATLDLLTLLGTNRVRIAGGTGVVSSAIQTQLNGLFTAPNVRRDSGANRYDTSVAVVSKAFSAPVTRALIATGVNFPDALAGAAWAGQIGAPLFIVPGTCVPQGVLDEIQSLGIYQISLIGGTGVLTSGVFNGTACP